MLRDHPVQWPEPQPLMYPDLISAADCSCSPIRSAMIEAMNEGLTVDYVIFDPGVTNDIGTHEEMAAYLKKSMAK